MDDLLGDLRVAGRQLRRHPGFTAVAVSTLALGIGAATVIFNVAEVALLRRLPFAHEDRLVRVFRVPETGTPRISLRPETYLAVERRGRFFDRIVAQRYTTFVHATAAGPERLVGIAVTAGWAETLGVRPALGRVFTPREEGLGAASGVAVLSHRTWQERFGGDQGAIGSRVLLDDRSYTIVGVMGAGMRFPYSADLWVPMRADDPQVGPWSLNVQARLAPGVSLETARAELRRIAEDAAAAGEAPTLVADGMTLTAVPLRELFVGDDARTTLALLGAVGFLLLIVCTNLASLLVARGPDRTRELAVRASLGARRGRLIRQLLTEALLLGVLGSAIGIDLAYLGEGLAQPLLPERLEFVEATVSMSPTVLAFAVGLALLTTLLFGLLPALRLSRMTAGSALLRARSTTDLTSRRVNDALVVAQIALAIVLLTGTGLIMQDLRRLAATDPGYDPAGLLTFSVSLAQEPYSGPGGRVDLLARATARLRGAPGIDDVGVTSMFPTDRGNALARVDVEGREDAPGTELLVNHRLVTPGFLEAVGVPVLAGRGLEARDRVDTAPVVVLSASAARRFWPDEEPIGRRVRSLDDGDSEWMTVVGVVADVREFFDVRETWYLPYAQHAGERSASSATFALRGAPGAAPAAGLVRRAMAEVAPDLPLEDLATAEDLHAASLTRQRQAAVLSAGFGAFGLLLAAMGVYGAVAHSVNRRKREFGIRMALGSAQGRILAGVVRRALRLVMVGSVLGAVGGLAAVRLLARGLETVQGYEPGTLAVALLALTCAALAAAVLPARRAARLDPMTVLREE